MEYFLAVFGFCSMTQQHLQLLNTSHIYLSYKKVSEEKLNHILKIDGDDKLFRDLLTNKIYYILGKFYLRSWNFKMKFCLNRGDWYGNSLVGN